MTNLEKTLTNLHGKFVHHAWRHRCAFPNCTRTNLQHAHILSKGAFPHWRWEEWNGILLCAFHHDCFDGRIISEQRIVKEMLRERWPWFFEQADKHKKMEHGRWRSDQLHKKALEFRRILETQNNVG